MTVPRLMTALLVILSVLIVTDGRSLNFLTLQKFSHPIKHHKVHQQHRRSSTDHSTEAPEATNTDDVIGGSGTEPSLAAGAHDVIGGSSTAGAFAGADDVTETGDAGSHFLGIINDAINDIKKSGDEANSDTTGSSEVDADTDDIAGVEPDDTEDSGDANAAEILGNATDTSDTSDTSLNDQGLNHTDTKLNPEAITTGGSPSESEVENTLTTVDFSSNATLKHATTDLDNKSDPVTTVGPEVSSASTTEYFDRIITENNTSTPPTVTQPLKGDIVSGTGSPSAAGTKDVELTVDDDIVSDDAQTSSPTQSSVEPFRSSTTRVPSGTSEVIAQTGTGVITNVSSPSNTSQGGTSVAKTNATTVAAVPQYTSTAVPSNPNVSRTSTVSPGSSNVTLENSTIAQGNSTAAPGNSSPDHGNGTTVPKNVTSSESSTPIPRTGTTGTGNSTTLPVTNNTAAFQTSTTAPQTTSTVGQNITKITTSNSPSVPESITNTASSAKAKTSTLSPDLSTTTEIETADNDTRPDCFLCTAYLSDMLTWDNYSGVAILAAILIGGLFILVVIGLVAKRCYDGFTYRGYKQVDYLINGMYDANDIDDDEEYEK